MNSDLVWVLYKAWGTTYLFRKEPFKMNAYIYETWDILKNIIEQKFLRFTALTYFRELATSTVTLGIRIHGNLRGPVTFTPIAEGLAVELSLPV